MITVRATYNEFLMSVTSTHEVPDGAEIYDYPLDSIDAGSSAKVTSIFDFLPTPPPNLRLIPRPIRRWRG